MNKLEILTEKVSTSWKFLASKQLGVVSNKPGCSEHFPIVYCHGNMKTIDFASRVTSFHMPLITGGAYTPESFNMCSSRAVLKTFMRLRNFRSTCKQSLNGCDQLLSTGAERQWCHWESMSLLWQPRSTIFILSDFYSPQSLRTGSKAPFNCSRHRFSVKLPLSYRFLESKRLVEA